jgi:hypothetical protein
MIARSSQGSSPGLCHALEALDFETGEDRFHVPTSFVPTQNSMWAATTVGPDASIWSGTFGGVTRWQQCASDAEECGRRPSLVEHLIGDPTSALPSQETEPVGARPTGRWTWR